ncbi:50S ribosomal protein L36 [Candidatus Karelsulcia muelleri]|nr:50S ribosomal protein L36 [Candidatus Karelsulcia muelleri]UOQ27797.1 50S ribosomal protein L36 [Candidatus Karelsulcia muelleri]UOQ38222.1 50S ribosomal protein L36 [Candidatus Karelsulcia muelleri]
MKKVTSLKRRSQNCKIVKRKGKLIIINKVKPKYKQKQR